MKKINLKNWNETKIFKEFVYPCFPKEFLFGNSYEEFANLISDKFILSEKQWECMLIEWEFKERMFSGEFENKG